MPFRCPTCPRYNPGMNLLHFAIVTKALPAVTIASVRIPTNHEWFFEVFEWRFGVVEFNIWGAASSEVFVGPLAFPTDLSALAVAAIAGGVAFALFAAIAVI